ncbi:Fungal-type cellulose-binding domain [Rhizoctonia solani]|uniref:Fungal-type cellulose-binding domain n=1 Tax=Rhizoctonia solani TaxID=456999 RepID=A0A8H7M7L1_9AGAM|nr:Fungal-type cellulose-binding domain [Rhizoctonia solani]
MLGSILLVISVFFSTALSQSTAPLYGQSEHNGPTFLNDNNHNRNLGRTYHNQTHYNCYGGGTVGPTLLPNYLWIRAVTPPNFHKYLQSYTPGTATDAVLADASTAGRRQFAITGGKLTQITPSGALLYANVEARADSTVNKLKVSWQTSSATSGTFVWSGDALTWTIDGITRPNNAAWLACTDAVEGQVLYVNLDLHEGSYGYNTPAGCSDHTIHYYNGAKADV